MCIHRAVFRLLTIVTVCLLIFSHIPDCSATAGQAAGEPHAGSIVGDGDSSRRS